VTGNKKPGEREKKLERKRKKKQGKEKKKGNMRDSEDVLEKELRKTREGGDHYKQNRGQDQREVKQFFFSQPLRIARWGSRWRTECNAGWRVRGTTGWVQSRCIIATTTNMSKQEAGLNLNNSRSTEVHEGQIPK
jgi:hypothetical protein